MIVDGRQGEKIKRTGLTVAPVFIVLQRVGLKRHENKLTIKQTACDFLKKLLDLFDTCTPTHGRGL